MPESIIRLAAGRYTMKEHEQFLCFSAGCNAIFTGERMLTTMCSGWDEDIAMLKKWGMKPMKSFRRHGINRAEELMKKTVETGFEEPSASPSAI